jgi:hypothetical protein
MNVVTPAIISVRTLEPRSPIEKYPSRPRLEVVADRAKMAPFSCGGLPARRTNVGMSYTKARRG